ncbi:hypothetical protein NS365_22880, partial [Aureimonas ureilytica]
MPKLQPKSAAQKRFLITASGHVKAGSPCNLPGLITHSNDFIRPPRGSMLLSHSHPQLLNHSFPSTPQAIP